MFNLALVGLDIHNEYQCVVYFLHRWLSGEAGLDDGMVVKLVSVKGALLSLFGLPWVIVFWAVRMCVMSRSSFFFFVAVDAFEHCFVGFKAFTVALALRGAAASFSTCGTIFIHKKDFRLISYVDPSLHSWDKSYMIMMYVWCIYLCAIGYGFWILLCLCYWGVFF